MHLLQIRVIVHLLQIRVIAHLPPDKGDGASPPDKGDRASPPDKGDGASPPDKGERASPTYYPAPPHSEFAETREAIMSLAVGFNGGSCFHIEPDKITAQSAMFEVYSGQLSKVEGFYRHVKQSLAFDPKVIGHLVSIDQCNVLSAIAQNQSVVEAPLILQAGAQKIKASNQAKGIRGESLNVAILDVAGRHLDVFLIDDAGRVRKVSSTCAECLTQGKYLVSTTFNDLPRRRK